MTRLITLVLALLCGTALAQTPPTPPATALSAAALPTARPPPPDDTPPSASDARGEPNVQHHVIEDQGAKIDELSVRGHTTRITVTPKVGTTKGYEIITEDGSRDVSDGLTGSRGAAGKRVWRVLSF